MLIIYYWPAKLAHVSCAITGLGYRNSRYISYFPGNSDSRGCKLHTFTGDSLLYKKYPPELIVIPTQEDGIVCGLSEKIIQEKWDAMTTLPEFNTLNQNCCKMVFDCVYAAISDWNINNNYLFESFSGNPCSQLETCQYYKALQYVIEQLYASSRNSLDISRGSASMEVNTTLGSISSGSQELSLASNAANELQISTPVTEKRKKTIKKLYSLAENCANCFFDTPNHKPYYTIVKRQQEKIFTFTRM